ncbi:MAG: FkbM family methyltransferase [Planctomycetaceae bacterium]|nr:FkbM family methyltransferase [Planctomycetaceae bacterium]
MGILKNLNPCTIIACCKAMIQKNIEKQRNKCLRKLKCNNIRQYFLSLDKSKQEPEIVQIIDYFEKHSFSVFPYDFAEQYHAKQVDVFYDQSCKMNYVLHHQKRLYFPKNRRNKSIQRYYNGLRIEQDIDSPHRYDTEEYTVKEGDVIADIGAAEGMWALNHVEKASKIFLFECEKKWVKALEKTFEPWKEKVVFINKYVSNITKDSNITLDDFLNNKEINFIKADIEGAEIQLLEGAAKILSEQNNLKLLLCAYHRKEDAVILKQFLEEKGFTTQYSKGYMLFIYDNDLDRPYIRRGLIRATKIKNTNYKG